VFKPKVLNLYFGIDEALNCESGGLYFILHI